MKIARSDRRPSVLDRRQHAVGPSKTRRSSSQGSQKIQDIFESANPSSNVSTPNNQREASGFFSTGLGKVLRLGAAALAGFGISKLIGKLTGKSGDASSASASASASASGNAFPDASQLSFEPTTDKGKGAYKGTAAVLFPASWAGKIESVKLGNEVAQMGVPHNGKPVFRFLKTGDQYSWPQPMTIKAGGQTYTMPVTQEMMLGGASGTGAPGSIPSDGTYAHSDTFQSYGVRNGGRQAWRIPNPGPHFGKSCKITFSDGTSVVVPDTSKNFRIKSGDKRGFVFKPGPDNGYSDKERDTSTSHHGVYLHAPYGNSSKSAKFEWN